jgi:hypothetical protein
MYENIVKGDIVVIKEGSHMDWCMVLGVSVDTADELRIFTLISKLNGKTHEVSISTDSGAATAYCPWRFVPANQLTSYNS